MRVAVIGSRGLSVDNLGDYLPENTTEIVSGGAKGVDTCAREYALYHGLKLTEYLPEYEQDIKRLLAVYYQQDVTTEHFESFDGEGAVSEYG